MLSVQNLCVRMGSAQLLDDVNLQLNNGEVLAVLGPNGAGKSTLLRAITGDVPVTRGDIQFHGKAMAAWDRQTCARHLAVLPQKSVLNFPFTGFEVVSMSRAPHATGANADRDIVNQALKTLDADHLADRTYTDLSGGEQQRVQLARVLAQVWDAQDKSRLLLLDEPAAAFDLAHQQMLVARLRELSREGMGIMVVLHDLNMALACADKVVLLDSGAVRAFGSADLLLESSLIEDVFRAKTRVFTDRDSDQRFVGLVSQFPSHGKSDRLKSNNAASNHPEPNHSQDKSA